MTLKADIIIYGGGIAGLWALRRLKALGYDALLLERDGLGGGQSVASQGILHSGLKYAIAGKVSKLAREISAMPERWRACLDGAGEIDLSAARMVTDSQHMLIPKGLMGDLIKIVAQKTLGGGAGPADVDEAVLAHGFEGSAVMMGEPVLDIPSVIRALAEPYRDCIRRGDETTPVEARLKIYTAAGSNQTIARMAGHGGGLEVQHRPLLMVMMRPAPFPLWAHLVGASEKPVASITTHEAADGSLVWYIGGGVAEKPMDADPGAVIAETKTALLKYMPGLDLSGARWASLPIERVEGKSGTEGWMPDTPTIHAADGALYCWPTKLTFAPMLGDMLVDHIGFEPSGQQSDFSALPEAVYAATPWDEAKWTDI